MLKTFSSLYKYSNRLSLIQQTQFNLLKGISFINAQNFLFASKKQKETEEDLVYMKNSDFAGGEKKIKKQTQGIDDLGIGNTETGEIYQKASKEKIPQSEDKVTTKLLCDVIGSKHYPSNEEITMSKETIVSVYDENDKFMTNMSLGEARYFARSQNKDLVLRNSKSSPVIVKVMKYKAELIKRLLKKVGKNIGRDLGGKESLKKKIFPFSLKSDKKDFDSKVDRLRQLLLENNFVKIVIPCNLTKVEESTKAISILKNIADEVSEMGKISIGPIKQQKKKEKTVYNDPGISASTEEIMHHDRIIKETIEASAGLYLENEKDLEYVDFIYLELESLVIDTGGVDYEKLLESDNIDNIVRGITQTNVSTSSSSKDFEETISEGINNLSFIDSASMPLRNQIDYLEKQAVHQKDLRQRLLTLKNIDEMKDYLEVTRNIMSAKIMKNHMSLLAKLDGKKSGLLEKKM